MSTNSPSMYSLASPASSCDNLLEAFSQEEKVFATPTPSLTKWPLKNSSAESLFARFSAHTADSILPREHIRLPVLEYFESCSSRIPSRNTGYICEITNRTDEDLKCQFMIHKNRRPVGTRGSLESITHNATSFIYVPCASDLTEEIESPLSVKFIKEHTFFIVLRPSLILPADAAENRPLPYLVFNLHTLYLKGMYQCEKTEDKQTLDEEKPPLIYRMFENLTKELPLEEHFFIVVTIKRVASTSLEKLQLQTESLYIDTDAKVPSEGFHTLMWVVPVHISSWDERLKSAFVTLWDASTTLKVKIDKKRFNGENTTLSLNEEQKEFLLNLFRKTSVFPLNLDKLQLNHPSI